MEVNARKMPVREATSTDASSVVPQGYKCTDVGIVPEDWQVMDLGDVAAMDVGYAFKSVWFCPDDGIRLLRGENVGYGRPDWSDAQRLPPKLAQEFNQYILRPGDIVIGMDRTFTKTGTKISLLGQADCPSLLVQRVGRFVPHACTGRYLWALLSSEDFRKALKGEQKGMDIPHLSRLEILSMRVPIPPNETEQETIGEALSDVDELLGALEALIAKKQAIKQTTMQQLFIGKTRLPGFSGEWETKLLGEIADVRTGPFGSALHERDYVAEGTPIITVEHLGERGVICTNLPQVSDMDRARLKAYSLVAGDIVFSRVGSIDRNALIRPSEEGWLFSGRLLRVRPDNQRISSSYLSYHFHGEQFKARVREVAVGQTMASLNTVILEGIEIRVPKLAEQYAIATVLSDMDSEIATLETRRDKTAAIKQGMIQQLLTGRIRLVNPQPAEANT